MISKCAGRLRVVKFYDQETIKVTRAPIRSHHGYSPNLKVKNTYVLNEFVIFDFSLAFPIANISLGLGFHTPEYKD